jgi:hypothetical protein
MNRDPLLAQEAIGPEHWSSMWPLVHLPGKRLGDPAKVARNHAQWLPFSKDTVSSVIFRLLLYDDCWGKLVHTCSYIFIARVSFLLWGEKVKCYHVRKHGSVTSLKRCWKCRKTRPSQSWVYIISLFFLIKSLIFWDRVLLARRTVLLLCFVWVEMKFRVRWTWKPAGGVEIPLPPPCHNNPSSCVLGTNIIPNLRDNLDDDTDKSSTPRSSVNVTALLQGPVFPTIHQ